ncbi:MAG: 50S ribosomal protein L23 [Desulfobacteraceae bacterium]|nr:50S ribosomal protein L23 [Desulfobacteraceae bacterium]MCF8093889.1 50S ribosomal protein L23 [Desulfobacteraceae bacterium]
MNDYNIIIGPVDTEKTNLQKEELNKVVFEVAPTANRVQIRKAIENIFDVRVKSVQTLRVKGKVKRRGLVLGKRKDWKKAIVTLMPGSRIRFFEGA